MLRNEAGRIKGRVPYIALGICDVSTEFSQLRKSEIFWSTPKLWSDQIIMRVKFLKGRIWVLDFVTVGSCYLFSGSLILKKNQSDFNPWYESISRYNSSCNYRRKNLVLFFKDQNKQVKRIQYTKSSVLISRRIGWLKQVKFSICNAYPAFLFSSYSSVLGASLIYTRTQIHTLYMYRLSEPNLHLTICSSFLKTTPAPWLSQ